MEVNVSDQGKAEKFFSGGMFTTDAKESKEQQDEKAKQKAKAAVDANAMLVSPKIQGEIDFVSPTVETTVGAAGSATAMPTPVSYMVINTNEGTRKIALFNV